MFIGHFDEAKAATKVAPGPSFGTRGLAALLVEGIGPAIPRLDRPHVAGALRIGRHRAAG